MREHILSTCTFQSILIDVRSKLVCTCISQEIFFFFYWYWPLCPLFHCRGPLKEPHGVFWKCRKAVPKPPGSRRALEAAILLPQTASGHCHPLQESGRTSQAVRQLHAPVPADAIAGIPNIHSGAGRWQDYSLTWIISDLPRHFVEWLEPWGHSVQVIFID